MKPMPPKWLIDSLDEEFAPAPELEDFFRDEFLNEFSPLFNPDQLHLQHANIGDCSTNSLNTRQIRQVVGMADIPKPPPTTSAWFKARYRHQLRQWFGTEKLDFLITLDAKYVAEVEDLRFCAVFDHEHY